MAKRRKTLLNKDGYKVSKPKSKKDKNTIHIKICGYDYISGVKHSPVDPELSKDRGLPKSIAPTPCKECGFISTHCKCDNE